MLRNIGVELCIIWFVTSFLCAQHSLKLKPQHTQMN